MNIKVIYSIIFCPGYCNLFNVNNVWRIALAWYKPKPDEESGGCIPKTRIPRGVGGRVAECKGVGLTWSFTFIIYISPGNIINICK